MSPPHEVETEQRATSVARLEQRARASARASLSLLVPGLGQLLQGRYLDGAVQFGTVVAYMIGAWSLGGGRALLFALLWNAWSGFDAYRHEAD